ncbi:CMP deaminase [Bradyrhizobium sp. 173]|nr:deaminase [Bradyrhizobium sp. 173]MCK1562804.1 CMP deaminase [Bradyrhizobium sp. 173]
MSSRTSPEVWDERFLSLAAQIGRWSKDRSAKAGCVIVGEDRLVRSTGFNGFPRKINDDEPSRHERPAKYLWSEHAERNAIYNAARLGISTAGCICYVNWFPCVDCARAVVQAGIVRLIGLEPDHQDPRWGEEFQFALTLFSEAGVDVTLYSLPALHARSNAGLG